MPSKRSLLTKVFSILHQPTIAINHPSQFVHEFNPTLGSTFNDMSYILYLYETIVVRKDVAYQPVKVSTVTERHEATFLPKLGEGFLRAEQSYRNIGPVDTTPNHDCIRAKEAVKSAPIR